MKKRGPKAKKFCRSVDIVADAAYAILIRDPVSCTGNLYFDEDVLKAEQITDLEQYRAEKCKITQLKIAFTIIFRKRKKKLISSIKLIDGLLV